MEGKRGRFLKASLSWTASTNLKSSSRRTTNGRRRHWMQVLYVESQHLPYTNKQPTILCRTAAQMRTRQAGRQRPGTDDGYKDVQTGKRWKEVIMDSIYLETDE